MSTTTNRTYCIFLHAYLASVLQQLEQDLGELLSEEMKQIPELVASFLSEPISPTTFLEFEERLQQILREFGRKVMEFTCNECEPERAEDAPHDTTYEAGGYRRMNHKTPNRYVETTFGRICLWRRGYRYWHRDQKEPNIFPLELLFGLFHGATPALANELSRMMAEAGATQTRVLEQAKRQFDVAISVQRLRDIVAAVAKSMEELRQHYQVLRLLELLHKADESRGRCKPVLSVGRDGICMPMTGGGVYQQGATATVTVYDRQGQRLGTVYLATTPESLQPQLTADLTALIRETLYQWCEEQGRPLPRLCYVTDAGDNECGYYSKVLCRMRDPRDSGKYLHWHRIIDYFHTTEKITAMAEALFGAGQKASSWARKMRKLLRQPSGASRVLHSAAAMRSLYGVRRNHEDDFERAYNYIRSRTRHMQYAEFKRMQLPIGSGVTEAACKTVFTQRLKLSGMGWGHQGAQVILDLRTILLSGIWDDVYKASVDNRNPLKLKAYHKHNDQPLAKAA